MLKAIFGTFQLFGSLRIWTWGMQLEMISNILHRNNHEVQKALAEMERINEIVQRNLD